MILLLLACTTPTLIVDADTGTNDVVVLDPITDTAEPEDTAGGTVDTADTAAEDTAADPLCAAVDSGWPYEAHVLPSTPYPYLLSGCGDVLSARCDDNTVADVGAMGGTLEGGDYKFFVEGWASGGTTYCDLQVTDLDYIHTLSSGYYVPDQVVTYTVYVVVL